MSAIGKIPQGRTSDADHVKIMASNVANDSALFSDTEGVTALAAGATQATGDISSFSHGTMIVAPSAANTLSVFGSINGVTFSTVPIKVYNATTLAYVQATALAAGLYYLDDLAFRNLNLTNSAGGTMDVTLGLKA